MNIRLMKIDDYAAVHDLWAKTAGIGLREPDDSRRGIEKFLKRNPSTCFVAENDGKIIGAIMAGHDGRRGHVYHTAVEENYRRQGIARRLLEETLAALKRQEIHKVSLVVFKENELGNDFWTGVNFNVRGDLIYRDKVLISEE